ncbi:hypothetical protein HHI36_009093 [Cryptolaemus montrouzieri]|uniref:Uncharacterized protein n=1 Tax=Cryptolaemus montrouzieri TaxID=559131 RepID=A0ABD2MUS3_9CUCU
MGSIDVSLAQKEARIELRRLEEENRHEKAVEEIDTLEEKVVLASSESSENSSEDFDAEPIPGTSSNEPPLKRFKRARNQFISTELVAAFDRVSQFSATCIDDVITDLSSGLSVAVTEELHFSDHRSQSFICQINEQNKEEQKWYDTRLITAGRILSLKKRIAGFNWEDKVKKTTAQHAASDEHTALMGMDEKCCPLKKRMSKKAEIKVKSSSTLVRIKQQLDILATVVSVIEEERLYDAYKRMKKYWKRKHECGSRKC